MAVHHFYPRSPCGERLKAFDCWQSTYAFLSTLSLRRATCKICIYDEFIPISIHALLAESDCGMLAYFAPARNFYPRSPCGERRAQRNIVTAKRRFLSTLSLRRATICKMINATQKLFLSTLSLRRATMGVFEPEHDMCISIHALLAESDAD